MVENVAPMVAKVIEKDTAVWIRPITHLSKSYFARDLLQTARATAAFRFHLIMSSTDLNERFLELVDAAAEYK
jgi:hypothetical protein